MPNRSPRVTSKSHIAGQGVRSYPSPKGGGWETFRTTPDKPANENVPRAKREAAIRAKYSGPPKGTVITSGKHAYGKPPPSKPSMVSRAASAVGKGVSSLAKGARIASPAGAFVTGMGLRPAGDALADKPSGPLMKGNAPKRYSGPPTKAISGGTTRSIAAAGPGASRAAAANSASKGSSSRTSGPPTRAQPSRPTASKSTGPSRGPTSAPSRTQPSKANLGTSRFAKGGAIKRRKK
jgi:hypothetical protein